MKIQFLNGGLANQAFQYIFTKYYNLLTKSQDVIYLDDTYFALNTVHNGYELERVFGIKAPMLSDVFDNDVWEHILAEKTKGKSVPSILCENGIDTVMVSEVGKSYTSFNPFEGKVMHTPLHQYNPAILTLTGNVYYHGYWINKNWMYQFEDEIKRDFDFPPITEEHNKRLFELICESNSLSIHIRRGDYINLGWDVSPEIIKTLINTFIKNGGNDWNLFVFSDDIKWCKENSEESGFTLFKNCYYVEGNTSGLNFRDMQLMSNCKGMILSGSAFSYLAALLNNRKEVYINPTPREL